MAHLAVFSFVALEAEGAFGQAGALVLVLAHPPVGMRHRRSVTGVAELGLVVALGARSRIILSDLSVRGGPGGYVRRRPRVLVTGCA